MNSASLGNLSAQNLSLARPEALYLLVIPAAVLIYSIISLGEFRRLFAPIMRALALALFVLALAGPKKVMRTTGTTRPAVVDVSASITPSMRVWDAQLMKRDLALRPDDPAILFGASTVTGTVHDALAALGSSSGCAGCAPSTTNLENALTAVASNPAARGGPAVVMTDGWENRGDAMRAVAPLLASSVRLYIFTPPGASSVPNVTMTELSLPSALSKSAPFALGVTMRNLNDSPITGTIQVYRNGSLLDQKRVTLPVGEERFDFSIASEMAGLDSYRASFKPDNSALDLYPEDDSLEGWVGVGARRRILILTSSQRDANYLETVVNRMGLEPVVVPVPSGQWNGSVAGYDGVILNNLPRTQLSSQAQNELAGFVARGGSLAMVGGDESFGLGGYQGTPIASIMPVIMKPPEHKERPRALILIIDKSGSMGRNEKLEYAKAAALKVLQSLRPDDLVGVIGFDSQPFVVVPLATVAQSKPYFAEMVNRLKAQGKTYLMPALTQAEQELASADDAMKHVVVLTDGETGGTADMYYSLVSTMRHDEGATISTIAIGQRDVNLPLLESISKYGGGGFYQTDSPQNLPEIFLADFQSHGGEATMVETKFPVHTTSPNAVLRDWGGRQLPALKGYVATGLKPRASLDAFVDRDGRHDPLIASWHYQGGKTIAVTTDASGRWSAPWITDNVFAPLWNRMLTWMTPENTSEQKLDVQLGYQAGRIRLRLIDYSSPSTIGSQIVNLAVTRPDGLKEESTLSEVAPGELSGSIEAPTPGTYYLEAKSAGAKAQSFPPLAYTVSPAVDAELPRPEPNYGLLEELASATGGRLNPSPSDVELTRPEIEQPHSLDSYLIVAAMILLIAEAFVRRLTV